MENIYIKTQHKNTKKECFKIKTLILQNASQTKECLETMVNRVKETGGIPENFYPGISFENGNSTEQVLGIYLNLENTPAILMEKITPGTNEQALFSPLDEARIALHLADVYTVIASFWFLLGNAIVASPTLLGSSSELHNLFLALLHETNQLPGIPEVFPKRNTDLLLNPDIKDFSFYPGASHNKKIYYQIWPATQKNIYTKASCVFYLLGNLFLAMAEKADQNHFCGR